jgi:outer membrane protein
MKNLSLILNAVLFVAVAVLYFLHFSTPQTPGKTFASADTASVVPTIAFINTDTLLQHYEFLKEQRTELEAKTKKMDQDLQNRTVSLRNEINAYQRNLPNMTLGQARAAEEDLGKKQQNLQLYQQTLQQQLMQDEAKLTQALYEKITSFLKDYSEERGINVVLKFDPSSDVLYGGRALDITQEVLEGLNDIYASEKKAGSSAKGDARKSVKSDVKIEPKADTTAGQ